MKIVFKKVCVFTVSLFSLNLNVSFASHNITADKFESDCFDLSANTLFPKANNNNSGLKFSNYNTPAEKLTNDCLDLSANVLSSKTNNNESDSNKDNKSLV